MVPVWLHVISIACVCLGFLCAIIVALDELSHPQHMWIMNVVWPVTALFGAVVWLWGYFRYGRSPTHHATTKSGQRGEEQPNMRKPFAIVVAVGASHCGSGCVLGDICAEWLAFAVPAIAVGFGWRAVFPDRIFAVWTFDYVLAYLFGVFFQYFTIAPMRGLGLRQGLWAAVKADTLSLTAWQVGMYGYMAFAYFFVFRHLIGADLEVDSFEFWFMMQIAMMFGFATSYPVNWWLIRAGLKEKM